MRPNGHHSCSHCDTGSELLLFSINKDTLVGKRYLLVIESKSAVDQSISTCNARASNGALLDDEFLTVARVKRRQHTVAT